MFKWSHTDSQSIYLWSMLCVNISVWNRFDFASNRTHWTNQLMIGLVPGNQSVDRQRPKINVYKKLARRLTNNSAQMSA